MGVVRGILMTRSFISSQGLAHGLTCVTHSNCLTLRVHQKLGVYPSVSFDSCLTQRVHLRPFGDWSVELGLGLCFQQKPDTRVGGIAGIAKNRVSAKGENERARKEDRYG